MDSINISLGIPCINVEKQEQNNNGDFIITVSSTAEGTLCGRCGKQINKSHCYDRETEFRHLPILGHKTYIRIRPKRYECPYCEGGPTTTQKTSWYDPKSPNTRAYEDHILLLMVGSTVSDVSMKEDMGYEAVMGMIGRRIKGEVNWVDIGRLDSLWIDEISLKKGHKDFITIIASYAGDHPKILGVVEGREKKTVRKFLSDIPKRLKKKIRTVCCDMYEGYINAAKEVFGKKVIIVADRFHVAKPYRKNFESLRKQEMKRLKKVLPDMEYGKLKGAMWALRKKDSDLRSDEREVLRRLFRHSPILKTGYELCEELTDIFELRISKNMARRKIEVWVEVAELCGMKCFESFFSTLKKRMEEMTNYFIGRQSSGFLEGLNNKIKVIKRRCYGIFNVRHLFQRIFLDLEGYSLFGFHGEI